MDRGLSLICGSTGKEPLVKIGEEVRFDPASFQCRLLTFTDVQGNA